MTRFQPPDCPHKKPVEYPYKLTSLDKWEEILDAPEDLGIRHAGVVRASENLLGQVATACVSLQLGYKTVILPSNVGCWVCCMTADLLWEGLASDDEYESIDEEQELVSRKARKAPKASEESLLRRRLSDEYDEDEDDEGDGEDGDHDVDSLDEMQEKGSTKTVQRPQIFIC